MNKKHYTLVIILPLTSKDREKINEFLNKHIEIQKENVLFLIKINDPTESNLIIKHDNVMMLSKPDSSLYNAWNQALDFLEQQAANISISYITFLGIDDIFSIEFFQKIKLMETESQNFDFIYGDALLRYKSSTTYSKSANEPKLFSKNNFRFDIFHQGLINRWKTIENQRFNENYKLAADLDFYIGICANNNITYKKIHMAQATIGCQGISNSPRANHIYKKEWQEIANKRKIKLDNDHLRQKALELISKNERIYFLMRDTVWFFKKFLNK